MEKKNGAPNKPKLPWTINIHSALAVYVQIENQIRFAMSARKLNAGDQLPSVRALSDKLEINPNTVAKAYRDLEVMGLVYTRRGMGVFVNNGAPAKAKKQMAEYVKDRVGEISREAGAAGLLADPLIMDFRAGMRVGAKEPIYA